MVSLSPRCSHLRKNIEFAIARFESGDLCGIVELEAMIDNVRLTHDLLSTHLQLDPFDVRRALFFSLHSALQLLSCG